MSTDFSFRSASRTTLSIRDALSQVDGVAVTDLARPTNHPRPPPQFIYGPVVAESLRHFHNDQYEPPISVFSLRNIQVIGPWFISGTLLVRDDIDFLCDGITLNPDNEESRKRLQEHFTATAAGRKTLRHVSGQTLLLANNGHQIYGHWLVDFLPKLHLLELAGIDIARINVLLPTNMGDFGEMFLRLLGFAEDRLIRYDPDRETVVPDELIVPTTLRWGGRCSPLFADAVAFLNERIDRFNRLPDPAHRRIFLSRGQSGRDGRPFLNEDRIEALAVAAGMTLVHPETLPLLDQIALFRGARRVLGQYGSGLHATIFSRPGVVVGGLHGQMPATFDALQSGVGERLGQPTGYVFASAAPDHANPWAITVDERDFAECLEREFPSY